MPKISSSAKGRIAQKNAMPVVVGTFPSTSSSTASVASTTSTISHRVLLVGSSEVEMVSTRPTSAWVNAAVAEMKWDDPSIVPSESSRSVR